MTTSIYHTIIHQQLEPTLKVRRKSLIQQALLETWLQQRYGLGVHAAIRHAITSLHAEDLLDFERLLNAYCAKYPGAE